jgi:hypothetical protein
MDTAYAQRRMGRVLKDGFRALDIAEPLMVFDAASDAVEAAQTLATEGRKIGGVCCNGSVVSYVLREELVDGSCGDHAHEIVPEHCLRQEAVLRDAINRLADHDPCFITVLGQPSSVLTRQDMGKPPVRMWLFGMITILEMYITRRVEERFPDDSWQDDIGSIRLRRAHELRGERARMGEEVRLVDCLQFSDKAQLLLKKPEAREDMGFDSVRAAKQAIKEFSSLRNNLAHSQDIVRYNWEQIIQIASRLDRIVSRV